jgi:hypothetical protein
MSPATVLLNQWGRRWMAIIYAPDRVVDFFA